MKVNIIASHKNWIEGKAVDQLKQTAGLRGIVEAVGMPDLHPGRDAPIGAVFACLDRIYPHLVGADIGCGISLWQLDLKREKITADRLERKLSVELEGPWRGNTAEILQSAGVHPTAFDKSSLGTIGSGNHFAEFSRVENVHDQERFAALKLDDTMLYLLVHSGSRGYGESILKAHLPSHASAGLSIESRQARDYLKAHDNALAWARANRRLIARRFMALLSAGGAEVLDLCHNHVLPAEIDGTRFWLHRKGAVAADAGPVLIAGTRGSLSYLVEATGDQIDNLQTLAHGAGRKWKRSDCRHKLKERCAPADLLKTALGNRVICDDRELLFEEAPAAYKNVDVVVGDLVDAKLVNVIATFAPVVTYKKRRAGASKR
jgi:release factor H-coupled RctB family protein